MTTLTFNNINFNPVPQNDGQIWLTSAELAKALGYAETDSVSKIYNRNKDEFTNGMTLTVKMGVNGINGSIRQKAVRIFSLRGCHLIGFFANTALAKQFRVWVLNILDKEVGQPVFQPLDPISTVQDRKPLVKAVDMLVEETGAIYSNVWRMVWQRFDVTSVEQLTKSQVTQAIEYVHSLFMQSVQKPAQPHAPFPIEQFQIGTMANTQSYRYLISIQNDINTINRRLKHMIDLNVQVNESFMAIG